MYLTDIRGFTAEDYYILPLGKHGFEFPLQPLCKITIHAMGVRGVKGLSLHFAKFCLDYDIEPRFISLSDMGISFFIDCDEKSRVMEALCERFPIWP